MSVRICASWDATLATVVCSLLLISCGGGGGSSSPAPGGGTPPPAAQSDFDQGIFTASANYRNMCQNPRPGAGFPDVQGSTENENDWLRTWSNDLYLWYNEITDQNPQSFATLDYFDLMKTEAITPSGAPRDQFHFTFDTEVWEQLSQSGITAGYGAQFELIASAPPREIVVAFVEPGSPASAPGVDLLRGTVVLQIDGVDAINGGTQADVDILNAGLFPDGIGESHQFVVEDVGGLNRRTITIVSAEITIDPVPTSRIIATAAGPVGYLLFNTHIATAEQRLVEEIQTFESAGIVDLVLDLRYNGGGFLDIANELAFMVAGSANASGRVFDETQFSDKHTITNPVTGAALAPDTFHTVTQGFSVASGAALPSVNLSRVFILSGPGTCSASEAVINGLLGIDLQVILIGTPTCGKPYGFFPFDNCGTTYFSIQFRGVNEKGFGDYADGFTPAFPPDPVVDPAQVLGCPVNDDFSNALGDESEALLATALIFMEFGDCMPIAAPLIKPQKAPISEEQGLQLVNPNRMPGSIRNQ